jgi:hypothetical protein
MNDSAVELSIIWQPSVLGISYGMSQFPSIVITVGNRRAIGITPPGPKLQYIAKCACSIKCSRHPYDHLQPVAADDLSNLQKNRPCYCLQLPSYSFCSSIFFPDHNNIPTKRLIRSSREINVNVSGSNGASTATAVCSTAVLLNGNGRIVCTTSKLPAMSFKD